MIFQYVIAHRMYRSHRKVGVQATTRDHFTKAAATIWLGKCSETWPKFDILFYAQTVIFDRIAKRFLLMDWWCLYVCLSVVHICLCLNLLCNLVIRSSAVSCLLIAWLWVIGIWETKMQVLDNFFNILMSLWRHIDLRFFLYILSNISYAPHILLMTAGANGSQFTKFSF